MARILTTLSTIALTCFASMGSSGALAAGSAANGAALFNRCVICHSAAKDGGNRVGPNLFGVVGRNAGTAAGYSYSKAMKSYGVAWDQDTLAKYLVSPSTVVPGTKMTFGGFAQPQQAADVAAYLATLK